MANVRQQARVLDGKTMAQTLLGQVRERLEEGKRKWGTVPGLRVIQVGDNAASSVYVRKKAEMANDLGLDGQIVRLPETVTQEDLLANLAQMNADAAVHAILVQLPLPRHMDSLAVQAAVAPQKDVDGFHPENLGALLAGSRPAAVACTPAGVLWLLEAAGVKLAGKHAVVLGRSNIVGKPMALLLLQKHCTVTVAHSKTPDLAALTRQADILVAAVGVPGLVTAAMVKPGATVIDVGINRHPVSGKLCGDVAYEEVAAVAGAITPVPGGIGPMTIAMLMANTVSLWEQSHSV